MNNLLDQIAVHGGIAPLPTAYELLQEREEDTRHSGRSRWCKTSESLAC